MNITEITRYVADDKSEFDNRAAADKYCEQADLVARLMSELLPKPEGCDFSNGHGYIQHDAELLKAVWNGLLDYAAQFLMPHAWLAESQDLAADASWVGRLIGEWGHKALGDAWYRMQCIDRRTAKEYGQPYFALHPNEAKGGCLNPSPAH